MIRWIKKRGQTEIIGVAIIVIILVVAGLFFLTMKPKKYEGSSYTDPELAQSLLNVLMNTKTDKNFIVSDTIKDCYSNKNDFCGSTTTADCCEYARKTMENALVATLGKWERSYLLTVTKGNDKRISDIPAGSKCTENSAQSQPGSYPIPPPPDIVVTLHICK